MAGENELIKFDPKDVKAVMVDASDPNQTCKMLFEDANTHIGAWKTMSAKQCEKPIAGMTQFELQYVDYKTYFIATKDK